MGLQSAEAREFLGIQWKEFGEGEDPEGTDPDGDHLPVQEARFEGDPHTLARQCQSAI